MINRIISEYVFTYKDISDEKIKEYIDLWQTPIGQYFKEKKFEAVDYALSNMAQTFVDSL